jgi:hypothetical protein
MIAADLVRRGYKVAIPYGEDWDFDLIVCRDERLERSSASTRARTPSCSPSALGHLH